MEGSFKMSEMELKLQALQKENEKLKNTKRRMRKRIIEMNHALNGASTYMHQQFLKSLEFSSENNGVRY